jgi:hypothetical protein
MFDSIMRVYLSMYIQPIGKVYEKMFDFTNSKSIATTSFRKYMTFRTNKLVH